MTTLRQAAQQALEALCSAVEPKNGKVYARGFEPIDCYAMHEQAIAALRTALEQQAEPTCPDCKAAVLYECVACSSNNYPTQQQAEPLTDKQILADETLRYYFGQNGGAGPVSKQGKRVVNAIEAAHGIKETKK